MLTASAPMPTRPRSARRPVAATGRFLMEVVTTSGRAAQVRFQFGPERVEIWHHDRCHGVFGRALLRQWLSAPEATLVMDKVTFSLDRMVDRDGRVALSMPDVRQWTLSPTALAELQKRL
jgi:hypothetical protein